MEYHRGGLVIADRGSLDSLPPARKGSAMSASRVFLALVFLSLSAEAKRTIKVAVEMPLGQPFTTEPQSIVNATIQAVDDHGPVCSKWSVLVEPHDHGSV